MPTQLRPKIEKAIDRVTLTIEDVIHADWTREQVEELKEALRLFVVAIKS